MVLRVFRPETSGVSVVLSDGSTVAMECLDPAGFYEAVFSEAKERFGYELQFLFKSGDSLTFADPYSFGPVLGEHALHFFGEGNHRHLYDCLGAQIREVEGVPGVSFAVWAPNARNVSVMGDFNNWDGRQHHMRKCISGIWDLFIPQLYVCDSY